MKKILVLVMSCRLPYYRDREREIADTFANPILKGEFPEMDLWFFNSGTKNCHAVTNKPLHKAKSDTYPAKNNQ